MAGTQLPGQFDRHAWQDTIVNGLLRDFPDQAARRMDRCQGDRPVSQRRFMSPREHDLERRNLETDDVAMHDGIFLSVTNGYIERGAVSMVRKNHQHLKSR